MRPEENLSKEQIQKICKKLGTEMIKYSFLSKGNHNINYKIETEEGKYVLRIEDNILFKNLKKEFNFLKMAKKGLGPKVYSFDNSKKILPKNYFIEEFIEGNHPSKNVNNKFVIEMAKWFNKLHKTIKKASKPYLLKTKVKPYYKNYLKYEHNLKDKKFKEELDNCISKALIILEKNNNIFVNRRNISLLHNDTSKGNIFYDNDSVRLIDWEFVSYGLPERELVYFLDSYNLTKNQQVLFLKEYGYPTTKQSKIQLSMAYIILLFSSIGYSLWQLDVLNKSKSSKKDKKERMNRLIRDFNLLKESIRGL